MAMGIAAPGAGPSMERSTSGLSQEARSARSTKSEAVASTSNGPSPHNTSLAQRLLQPRRPASPLLPIITSPLSTYGNAQRLNEELYDFIALALRAFVAPWWSKLAQRDKEFIPEISIAIIHVLREIERRVLAADLSSLILVELPTLVAQHYKDYRAAAAKTNTSYAPEASLPRIFHSMQSHIAVGENGEFNDTYLRQAVDHVLKSCLHQNDWDSEMERSIVREVIVRPILGSVLPKLSQPWFLHSIALSLLGVPRPLEPPLPSPPHASRSTIQFHDLIIMFLTFIQTISTFCLQAIAFFQHANSLINVINALPPPRKPLREGLISPTVKLLSEVLSMKERASSVVILSSIEVTTGLTAAFLDKFLPHILHTNLLTADKFTDVIALGKRILFPDGYPGPPPVVPSPEEQIILRQTLKQRLRELIPPVILPYLAGATPTMQNLTISDALEPFSSSECNAHLVILIFDAILLALFPEMAVGGGATSGNIDDEDGGAQFDAMISEEEMTPNGVTELPLGD